MKSSKKPDEVSPEITSLRVRRNGAEATLDIREDWDGTPALWLHLKTSKGTASWRLESYLNLDHPSIPEKDNICKQIALDAFRRIKGESTLVDPVMGEGRKFR